MTSVWWERLVRLMSHYALKHVTAVEGCQLLKSSGSAKRLTSICIGGSRRGARAGPVERSFVGVTHGGPCARWLSSTLCRHVLEVFSVGCLTCFGKVGESVLDNLTTAMCNDLSDISQRQWISNPQHAAVGEAEAFWLKVWNGPAFRTLNSTRSTSSHGNCVESQDHSELSR
eukprot:6459899-Amphidinium_carterae.3